MSTARPSPKLSVAMICRNEAARLPRTLAAVSSIADEVVIFDSGSSDGSQEIARASGAVVHETDWPGYGLQKQRALEACTGDWILCLDADEVPDAELCRALADLPAVAQSRWDGFRVDRLTEYQGDFVRHTWSPEWLLRVCKRGKGRFTEALVHETLGVDGRVAKLPGKLLHYPVDDLAQHYVKQIGYARLSAAELHRRGRSFRAMDLALRPLFAFFQRYVLKLGFLDGVRGLLAAGATAKACFMKYAFLYERERLARLSTAVGDEPVPAAESQERRLSEQHSIE